MRNDYLSLHQFEPVAPYVDSLLISTYSPQPLDVAVPFAASRLIVNSLTGRLLQQFGGRMTHLGMGAATPRGAWDEGWYHEVLSSCYPYPVRFGVILTDRVFLQEWTELSPTKTTKWVVFDWWQWVRRRVPTQRHTDALMFLCQASEEFAESPERTYAGIPDAVLEGMQVEGNRLFHELLGDISDRLLLYWKDPFRPNLPE